MPIVCPHCATSYAVDPATLGAGRNVRCARCKEIWLARPPMLVLAAAARDAELEDMAPAAFDTDPHDDPAPMVESPPLAGDRLPVLERRGLVETDAPAQGALIEAEATGPALASLPAVRNRKKPRSILPTATVAMLALVAALIVWRVDMVRLMPQTAGFYRLIGLDVNPRGLAFRDVKSITEAVDGKPVLMIEGSIQSRRAAPAEIPRLQFVVRNAQGTAIYSWDAKPDQAILKPGEVTAFRARLASPPPEAHSLDVRFQHKRDLAAGAA